MKPNQVFSFVFSLLLVGAAATVYVFHQTIIDKYIVTTQPLSSQAQALADQVKFTAKGDYLFASGEPQVEQAASFNQHCTKKETGSYVLGCYIGPQHIYIYDVSDARLAGVQQVTAAHETLHAAYGRLGSAEKQKVNAMIEAALPVVEKANSELASRLQLYDRTEPGERDNELHSIFGTEVAVLPAPLENYYKQYFTNRSIVTHFAAQYAKVFTTIKDNQTNLVAQLGQLNSQISQMVESYNADLSALNSDIETFNRRASRQDGFSSQQEFDSQKAALSDRQQQLEARKQTINQNISTYKEKQSQLEALNVQVKGLNAKLDSSAGSPSL